jgi:hypothetical protein
MRVDTGFPGKRGLCQDFADFGLGMIFGAFCHGSLQVNRDARDSSARVVPRRAHARRSIHIFFSPDPFLTFSPLFFPLPPAPFLLPVTHEGSGCGFGVYI